MLCGRRCLGNGVFFELTLRDIEIVSRIKKLFRRNGFYVGRLCCHIRNISCLVVFGRLFIPIYEMIYTLTTLLFSTRQWRKLRWGWGTYSVYLVAWKLMAPNRDVKGEIYLYACINQIVLDDSMTMAFTDA